MSETSLNQREIEKLYQWASEYHTEEIEEKYFTKIDKKCASYFEPRVSQAAYCREYTYDSMPKLRDELEAMWKDDDVMKQIEKVVLVAAMKNKPLLEDNIKSKMNQLKPYIYNF